MQAFNEFDFRRRVDIALTTVRQIVHRTRCPVYAADAQHSYSDKFVLSNLLVRLALGSTFQALSVLGISEEEFATLLEWSKDKTVSLRLKAEEKCKFVKETVREQESATRTETAGHIGAKTFGSSTKTVTRITEYVWKFEGSYQLLAFRGVGASEADQIAIRGREYTREIVTGAKTNPRHDHRVHPNVDVDISWLLQHVSAADGGVSFEIARADPSCRTPRRNKEVDAALQHMGKLSRWAREVWGFMQRELFRTAQLGLGQTDRETRLDVNSINPEGVFVPVAPLFIIKEQEGGGEHGAGDGPGELAFKPTDISAFIAEQHRSLTEKIAKVAATLPAHPGALITGSESHVAICVQHVTDIVTQLSESVGYVEHMLRQQLYAAIGKEISSEDFAAFKRFHNRKLFREDAQPVAFSYAVRRSELHSPEGMVAIEEKSGGSMEGGLFEPVFTHVRGGRGSKPMKFNINAATSVRFNGERFVHAWLMTAFSGQTPPEVQLTAQARQLSSFIVLIGRVVSADTFEPKYGMIVQNKDDFRIPLNLTTIPTAKEFKEAIDSMSPEQQRFAKAWRAMQLESTLFAVCVVQIKPLLERVLNLPPESLSKEIKLTQDLTELFIKYQIPADLLTAGTINHRATGGGEGAVVPTGDKVAEVKSHVEAMQKLIEGEKGKQLTEAAQTAVFNKMAHADSSSESDYSDDDDAEVLEDLLDRCDAVRSRSSFADLKKKSKGSVPMLLMKQKKAAPKPHSAAPRSAVSKPGAVVETRQKHAEASPTIDAPPADATPDATLGRAEEEGGGKGGMEEEGEEGWLDQMDLTELPAALDKSLQALDAANAVRPTIITAKEQWVKRWLPSLMSKTPETATLGEEELRSEKGKALELLDALTRSGALVVEEAALHVILAATHAFDKGLVDTVVQDNLNPILQVERSSLIMASSATGMPAASLIRPEHEERVRAMTPALFLHAGGGGGEEEEEEPRTLSGLHA